MIDQYVVAILIGVIAGLGVVALLAGDIHLQALVPNWVVALFIRWTCWRVRRALRRQSRKSRKEQRDAQQSLNTMLASHFSDPGEQPEWHQLFEQAPHNPEMLIIVDEEQVLHVQESGPEDEGERSES